MALTLGITGMDSATEAQAVAAFKAANADTGQRWSLVQADAADYVLIDMDSLYGPMSWLRLHALGRKVIALTSSDRSQTDFSLPHPLRASDLTVLLSEIATDTDLLDAAGAAADSTPPAQAGSAPLPEPLPEPEPEPEPVPEPTPAVPAAPSPEVPPAPAPAQEHPLRHWLAAGLPRQRLRLQHGDAPVLLLDMATGHWHGGAALKSLAACFDGTLVLDDFTVPAAAAWDAEAATLGPEQPLARLQWLGGLLSNAATSGPYLLKKWPQTEREFPKHFRIATVMMKGPATTAEIAEASGVPEAEVAGFINANLATGYAEAVGPAPANPDATPGGPKATGLFGRLRGH
ncbi:hypothetical protein [Thermomonas sp.]|uniref:hypothetical protein n=1 Tax=Thermomonas sp. TaxID=1971895 RepID=UPI0035B12160